MTRFAIYSTESDLLWLYQQSMSSFDTERVEKFVGIGDRPPDFLVDVQRRHLLWTFIGEHRMDDTHAGYFVAEYQAGSGDLFRDFERALETLHYDDDWAIPHSGDLRWNAGFQLWRITPDLPGITQTERQRLFDHLRSGGEPLEFRMSSFRTALQAMKAIYAENLPCTVAVDGEQREGVPDGVDILFRPTGDNDFEPISVAATKVFDSSSAGHDTADQVESHGQSRALTDRLKHERIVVSLAGVVLAGLLGLALYSFIRPTLIHPITGLATIGGFVGALLAFPGMAALILGASGVDEASNVITASGFALRYHRPLSLLTVTYGTILGFAYPALIRVAGSVDGTPWVVGPVDSPLPGLLSIVVFTALLCVVSWLFVSRVKKQQFNRGRLVHLVIGHVVYALPLFVATGIASSIWYRFLPAV